MTWLRDDFAHPPRADLPTGHHLRPIRAGDVDLDLPAVMGSRERLWARYGQPWGWPPARMTREQDREDLAHHEDEMEKREGYNYCVLNAGESELFGCVYIYPPQKPETDAMVSWWVVDDAVGSELEHALEAFIPRWLDDAWGLRAIDWSP